MLARLRRAPGRAGEPAPAVTLDGIEMGFLIFQAIAYVHGPRLAGGVRSELLFTILDGCRPRGLPMAVAADASVPGAMGPSLAPAAPTPSPPPPLPGIASD